MILSRLIIVAAAAACLFLTTSHADEPARPGAPHLLPAETLAYVRIANVPELVEKFRETAMGRIVTDPQVQPFVGDLYRSAAEAFQVVEDRVGVPLHELLAIPQGELCIALVAAEQGRPQPVAFFDVGDHLFAAEQLIESAETALAQQGATRTTKLVDKTDIVIHTMPGDRQRRIAYFIREGVIGISSDEELLAQILGVWDGDEVNSLAENRTFTAIMKRSVGFKDEPPQITWYADPILLARKATQGNFSAQAGISLITGLGFNGVKAVGGSLILATEEFDGIFHTHLMLENPRNGVLKMIAFEAGEVTPEPWVPKDAASYASLNWNVDKTYTELTRLYDTFRGEDAWKDQVVETVGKQLGIDLEKEVVNALEGRATMVTWMQRPARINSQSRLGAFKLKDPAQTSATLDRVAAKFPERLKRKTYGGATYYLAEVQGRNRQPDAEIVRIPTPCLAVLGDYFLVTDSEKFFEQVVITQSDASLSLANELDFKLIANKIQRQQGETKAGMISFNRPEESFRTLYELATANSTQTRLAAASENNGVFRALNGALTNNPLPPFAVLARYLAPGGALVTDDETGIHYTAFTLRRD
ncbi:MAG: hypothetical protein O3C40_04395 [Planctomycetota bacterium]|nr:hypothetical protein [Planctomycetota bacterium]